MPNEPSIRASILIELGGYLEGRGVALDKMLREPRLRAAWRSRDPLAMVPLEGVARLFDVAAARLDDPCFGLRAAKAIKLPGMSLLAQLTARAATVRDALKCAAGFAHIFITRIEAGFMEHAGIGKIYWRPPAVDVSPVQFNAFMLAGLIHRLRRAAGPDWVPVSVDLPHRRLDCNEAGLLVFGPRVRYNRTQTCVTIDAATLGRAMPDADPIVFTYLNDLAERWLADIGTEDDASALVSHELATRLRSGRIDIESVAGALGLAPRTLKSRLERLGTSYGKVVSDTRAGLAAHLLRDTDMALSEIAEELGFSDASAFSRASRRWFAMPPRAFRLRHRRPLAARSSGVTSERG
ncbi:MAG: AraC family transcriptional regulator ligand-binding domain-containing protein [Pseudomonadota bacterium]